VAREYGSADAKGYSVLCDVIAATPGYETRMDTFFAECPYSKLIPQIRYRHALNLFYAGQYAEALEAFESVKPKQLYKSDRTEYLFDRAYCNMELQQYDVAYDRFLEVNKLPFSDYTGPSAYAMGYIRYQNAEYLIHRAYAAGELSAEWIFKGASRSFFNAMLDSDLMSEAGRPESGWAIDQDYIPRNSSSASVVVEGVKKGENPDATTIWSVLGYPPCSYAVAAWVKAGDDIARIISASEEGHSPINLMAVDFKRKVFPVDRGNGKRYMRVDVIERAVETLRPYEEASMRRAAEVRDRIAKQGFSRSLVAEYNKFVDEAAPKRDEVVRQVAN
jgi:tetratricopeptide (TPR) repeat protein